ncbi:MAG TPA: hypothetical protein VJ806_04445 [Luteimonas sp.]|nr:hypothetical protein [Luteimonas sp.]
MDGFVVGKSGGMANIADDTICVTGDELRLTEGALATANAFVLLGNA